MARVAVIFRLIAGLMLSIWSVVVRFATKGKNRGVVPSTNDPLFSLSATQIALKIRTKQVSSAEVVSTFINRIKQVNPVINAVVEDRYADALKDAENVDNFLKTTKLTEDELARTQPMLGVPITIKESLGVKGMNFAVGSVPRIGIKAEDDGDCVKTVRAAGAIPLCITNTPEYCLSVETYNFITGSTYNPYNTMYNSGGSSGGEGALIGAAGSVCGLGSDVGGSIRIPASFNCIFGHKLSPDLVSLVGHFPTSPDPNAAFQVSLGPLVRYAEDLPLITKIITGNKAELLNLDQPVDMSKLKVFHVANPDYFFGLPKVQHEMKAAIPTCAKLLQTKFKSNVEFLDIPEMAYIAEITVKLHFCIKGISYPFEHTNVYWEAMKSLFGLSNFTFACIMYFMVGANRNILPCTEEELNKDKDVIKEKLVAALGTSGVLLFPSYPTSAIPHGSFIPGAFGTVNTMFFNVLGLPATNVPIGFDDKGLPFGIQVIAAPNQDRLCFAVAKELETLCGGWRPPY